MLTQVTDHTFQTAAGPRTAVVVTPQSHSRVGRARLESFRQGKGAQVYRGHDIDREVLAHARAQGGRDHVIVFRGRGSQGSWDLDADLTPEQAVELGYHLVADQLQTYRRLVAAGVFALLHVDWPELAVGAYIQGTERLRQELESRSIPEVAHSTQDVVTSQIDRWVLEHLTFFFSDPFERVIEAVLSRQVPLLEQRIPHLRAMVASLPPESVA